VAEVNNPHVLAPLARVDAMPDYELRVLVRNEHPGVIETTEATTARRPAADLRIS
jgi:hypothetical protein